MQPMRKNQRTWLYCKPRTYKHPNNKQIPLLVHQQRLLYKPSMLAQNGGATRAIESQMSRTRFKQYDNETNMTFITGYRENCVWKEHIDANVLQLTCFIKNNLFTIQTR